MSTLQTTKPKKGKKASKRRLTDQEQFQNEWERVQRLQKQNDKLREEMNTLMQHVADSIGPEETRRVELLYGLNAKLIRFIDKRSLPEYLREELVNWVYSGILEIQANPFAENNDVSQLHTDLNEQIASVQDFHREKLEKRLLKQGYTQDDIDQARQFAQQQAEEEHQREDEQSEMDDMFEELFEEFFADSGDEDEWGEFEERIFEEYFGKEQNNIKDKENQLDQLLKATPINRLFRKIARVLHPDLETDEQKKQLKHEQMSKLLHAREEKDILTIISLYIEHVGEMPQNVFDGNFDKMTELLKHQTQKLRDQKQDILQEDPVKAMVYERFASKTDRELEKKINAYKRDLQNGCQALSALIRDITSVKTLRPYLEDRQIHRHQDHYLDFDDLDHDIPF